MSKTALIYILTRASWMLAASIVLFTSVESWGQSSRAGSTTRDLEARRLTERLEEISEEIRSIKRRTDGLTLRIEQANQNLNINTNQFVALSRARKGVYDRLKGRLNVLYQLSKQDQATLAFRLVKSPNFPKYAHYLVLQQRTDKALLENHQSLWEQLRKGRRENSQILEELNLLEKRLVEEQTVLETRLQILQQELSDIKSNQIIYQRYVSGKKTEQREMENQVSTLNKRSKSSAKNPQTLKKGQLPAPIKKGAVIARFGAQDPRYALKKFQRGIVFRSDATQSVHAIADGKVLHAGPFRGYQQLVVVDHGQQFFSVYGHLENVSLRRGQQIKRASKVGQITYQPVDEAFDLYFEVRHKGKPIDPLLWIKLPSAIKK